MTKIPTEEGLRSELLLAWNRGEVARKYHAIATGQAKAIMRMQGKLDHIEDVVEYQSCDWEETCRLVSAILSEEGKAND